MTPPLSALAVLACVITGAAGAYLQVRPGYEYVFPADYFAHPEFRAEWWYYTGNLDTRDGRAFGYELTFFRIGLDRVQQTEPRSAWDLTQVYLAHFALTDVAAGRLHKAERVNRSGPGLAGASLSKSTIWNGNWSVEYSLDEPELPVQRLWAGHGDIVLDLELRPAKPVVIHGEDGISRKGGADGQASHYLSFTRLLTQGTIEMGGETHEVEGLSWMDHEYFSERLARNLVGWDWFSIQLDDGTELMLYGLRQADGGHSSYSSGTFVDRVGQSTPLGPDDVRLDAGRSWRSPQTGGAYPLEWNIAVDSLGLRLSVSPLLDSQEIISDSGFTPTYWEGAVRYAGRRAGKSVTGRGYLEMTGYAEPFSMEWD